MKTRTIALAFQVGILLMVGAAQAAPTAAQKCQSGKNVAAGKYAACRPKAEAKFAVSLDAAKRSQDWARCQTKLEISGAPATALQP